ncbi:hypothetical protein PF005_g19659 [Phytophthora fragariae]|uniref:Uncharacterized protein n=2 Tax=Phytophthora TaxID=4783 RepID=A0A6A4AYL1_9STRA|nr:hypothetical protein PF003_g14884 [Phytophthora fragariae]KAE8901122.1 hypothetical protein PF003_g14880 [Phytophthora fragariae]KAE8918320.1 hypothetical protein PF009_g31365 [Phytophthora fragariae]KAE8959414.1 hypothetical protein PF011_g30443 [Phytophthora fragariae]KAE9058868.1 hypothetical protein PF010_g30846 [Phytophthora fragariae]
MESVEQSTEPAPRKQVRWGTVSVLEFRVGYNASTVPESGGPPVGLVGRPTRHSYSMLPAEEEDAEASDSECESVDSDAEMLAEMPLLATGRSRRSLNDLWLEPMERARILAEEHAFPLEDVALICRDVRATLDARAFSQLDDATEMKTQAASDSCAYGGGVFTSGPREKVLLY